MTVGKERFGCWNKLISELPGLPLITEIGDLEGNESLPVWTHDLYRTYRFNAHFRGRTEAQR